MAELMTPEKEALLIDALLSISSGRLMEAFFFGDRALTVAGKPKKLPLFQAFSEVLQIQRPRFDWDTKSPVPIASRILLHAIRKHLHRARLAKQLELYVAAGTSLDWHHHMDAIIACGRRFVGIDITTETRVGMLDEKDAIIAQTGLPIILIPISELAVVGGFDAFGKKIADRLTHELSLNRPSIHQQLWFTAKGQLRGS